MTTSTSTATSHLEHSVKQEETTKTPSPSHSSRKSQRVYRSPSDPNDPSPFTKLKKTEPCLLSTSQVTVNQEEGEEHFMEIDEKDEEAGTILMALAQHASRVSRNNHQSIYHDDEKPTRSNSMSIRNLLDPETDASIMPPHVSPYHSLSSESKPLFTDNYEARRNSSKKGFQICIQPRRNSSAAMMETNDDYHRYERRNSTTTTSKRSFRHPNTVRMLTATQHHRPLMKYKRNTTHIHISYRIHAHRQSLRTSTYEDSRYETINSPYPSAFRTPSQLRNQQHRADWSHNHHNSPSTSSYHYRHQQDNKA